MRRPYYAESAIQPGTGVVQGSKSNTVSAPDEDGGGDFIGVYAFEDNDPKAIGDDVGVALSGPVKVLAGGSVTAGKKAVLAADDTGAFLDIPEDEGQYATCGTFLESGAAGEYVDMIVERGSVTIAASA